MALDKGLTASTLSQELHQQLQTQTHCPHHLSSKMRYAALLRSHEQLLSSVLSLDLVSVQSLNADLMSLTRLLLSERQEAGALQSALSRQAADLQSHCSNQQVEIQRLNAELDASTNRAIALQEHSTMQGHALLVLSSSGDEAAAAARGAAVYEYYNR